MSQEKIDEYNRKVKELIKDYYEFGKAVIGGKGLDDEGIISLLNLDLFVFVL